MDYPRFALLLYAILGPSPRDSLLVKEGLQLKVGEGLEHMGRDERGRGILRVCYLHVGIMDRGRDKCCHGVMRAVEGEIGLQSELNAKLVASAPWLGPRVGLLQTFTSKLDFCQGVRWRQLQPKVPTIYCPLCGSGDVITRLQECIQSGIILGVLLCHRVLWPACQQALGGLAFGSSGGESGGRGAGGGSSRVPGSSWACSAAISPSSWFVILSSIVEANAQTSVWLDRQAIVEPLTRC